MLQVYFHQLHRSQIAFSVKQKQSATLDKAVTVTIQMETYMYFPPKTAAAMANLKFAIEEEAVSVCPLSTPSTISGDDNIQLSLDRIIERTEALKTAIPEKRFTSKDILCYICGKKVHIARNCHGNHLKQSTQQLGPGQNKRNLVIEIMSVTIGCHPTYGYERGRGERGGGGGHLQLGIELTFPPHPLEQQRK